MPTQVMASRATRPAARTGSRFGTLVGALARAAFAAAAARKGLTFAALIVLALAAAVSRNALVGQAGPHPFPMFGGASPAGRMAEPRPAPLPVARPKDLAPPAEIAPAAPLPAPAAAPAPVRSAGIDAIGDLLRAPETGSIKPADPQREIALAQRGLTRLGYGPLKADGVMGAGTRLAVQRFQQDSKLPVTGEIGPRTSRALAAKANAPAKAAAPAR